MNGPKQGTKGYDKPKGVQDNEAGLKSIYEKAGGEKEPKRRNPPPTSNVLSNDSREQSPPMKAVGRKRDKSKERESVMKIVEISTDEECDDDRSTMIPSGRPEGKKQRETVAATKTTSTAAATGSKPFKAKAQVYVEIIKQARLAASEELSKPLLQPSPARNTEIEAEDTRMIESGTSIRLEDVEPEAQGLPRTPPRQTPDPTSSLPRPALAATKQTIVFPALSKLPFTRLENLTDAELDMTVEEWIRYQMGVEFDKFKRDGERELARWMKRAEEAKEIIRTL
jgi:hypothetical protein